VRIGRARAARYALARELGRAGSHWPLYRIDASGRSERIGELHALTGERFWFESSRPLPAFLHGGFASGVLPGLPWFLDDQRPQGFLGRAFARRVASDINANPDVLLWNADDVLLALLRHGDDGPGDLLVGEASLQRALQRTLNRADGVRVAERADEYPKRAEAALRGENFGSSAGGEQPKFTARVSGRAGPRAVIVKFSPPTGTEVGRRWADLLICEHLALEALRAHGLPASQSAVLESGDRVFLEVTRFDRVGARGRKPLASMFAIDAEFIGGAQSWSEGADRLLRSGQLGAAEAATVMRFEAFGRLIQNSDRHLGNLSFFWEEPRPGAPRFTLAPLYDMLPMAFRPQADQVIERAPLPAIPDVHLLPYWEELRAVAKQYWVRVRADPRVSRRFKSGPAAAAAQAIG
jgi:hypothetical protein